MSSSTSRVSSAVGFSRSTQRNKFVSASSVGIRKDSMSLLCSRPCVVKANERIIQDLVRPIGPCFISAKLSLIFRQGALDGKVLPETEFGTFGGMQRSAARDDAAGESEVSGPLALFNVPVSVRRIC
jgi:hypothetical protein